MRSPPDLSEYRRDEAPPYVVNLGQGGAEPTAVVCGFLGCETRPFNHLAQWRMQLAAHLLREGGAGIAEIAQQVGYASEAAFSRAYKRLVGVAPALWRQGMRSGEKAPPNALELWHGVV